MTLLSFQAACVCACLMPLLAVAQQPQTPKSAKRNTGYELPLNDTLRLATDYLPSAPPPKDGLLPEKNQTAGFPQPALVPVTVGALPATPPAEARSVSQSVVAPPVVIRQAVRQIAVPVPTVVDSARSDLERLLNRKKRNRY